MRYLPLIGFIAVAELAGGIGSFFTASSIPTWYAALAKPALNPPSWVFGPVWTTLYALMGIAAYLVWKRRGSLKRFWLQLALNTAWSPVFFGYKSPGLALIVIVAMWLAILATILGFKKVSKPTAWLLAPYLAWVTFATYLNWGIWHLN